MYNRRKKASKGIMILNVRMSAYMLWHCCNVAFVLIKLSKSKYKIICYKRTLYCRKVVSNAAQCYFFLLWSLSEF